MKHLILLLLLACLSLGVMAQTYEMPLTGFAQKNVEPGAVKAKRVRLPHIEYRHDFRVGVGLPLPEGSVASSHNSSRTPTIYFFYGYRVIKGFKVTGTISYSNVYREQKVFSGPHFGSQATRGGDLEPFYAGGYGRNHHIRISPAVHYEWYNRGIVTMYSDLGVTFDITIKRDDVYQGVERNRGTRLYFRPNVTPFGITIGKKLFGFAEVFSFGPRGIVNAGIGYRF